MGTVRASQLEGSACKSQQHELNEESEAKPLLSIHFGDIALADPGWRSSKRDKLMQPLVTRQSILAFPMGVNFEILSEDVGSPG